ncbi:MAG: hypothetical protein Q9171_004425 [Xanthocarpia ochracea]
MTSVQQTILYFGDQTDPWADGIDQLYRQAAKKPWLQSFLDELGQVFKEEAKGMDPVLLDSFGHYSSLLELADRYRYGTDEMGMAHALLLHALRAAMLLQWVKREPELVNKTGPKPEALGISGGLTNLSALAIAKDFDSLYDAVLEGARVFARICRLTLVRSRAMEDYSTGAWGWAVLGIAPDELRKVLEHFQESMGIPPVKRAKVGVTGDRWSTIIGPPSVLELCLNQCPAVRSLAKNPLNIHALQHHVKVSPADMDYIVGNSALLDTPILHGFRIWGMDDFEATYTNWGDLLRAVVLQILSLPLDITKVLGQLSAKICSRHLDVRVIGPSSHIPFIANALKAGGSTVSFQHDKSLEEVQLPGRGQIAIVGMAGRGPGSDNLEEFWDIIMSKQDLCEEIPKDRFDIEEFYCPEHGDKCTTTTRFGCFMNKPGNFDSRFFQVSPREALYMDPGHRQFLMSTYEALETAGYSDGPTRTTNPKRIAAFYGQSNDDWHMVSHYSLGCDAYTLQGAQRAFGAGRIPFHFKWEGPTYSVDSACASSTSATHLASMSLLTKDIDMAVVGAANILGYPHSWTSLSKSGVLSDTGNCKTYRDDADGYCRGDFVGTVVLKRLEDAVAQNDNILAVLAGTGRNHSGNSTSITTSDAGAQERLFRKVMQTARVSPDDISYVEMHGTGTQVGDPAEMDAVASIFKQRRGNNALTVGGVKANIGHSEAASNIYLDSKGIMPPQAGMPHALNPRYPSLSSLNIEIPSEPKEFKSVDQKPRRILLNNFDAAGGNACMVLEDYTIIAGKSVDPRPCHVIVTSAKTKVSYQGNKRRLLEWLRANPGARIEDIAYTTTARRMHHPIRFACTASTTPELISKLEKNTADTTISRAPPIVFVFTGQGSHYAGMGSGLYLTCSAFRETVDLCASICEEHKFPHFLDIITNNLVDMSTKNTIQTQLAVVTLEIGLAAFWRSSGIQPSIVMGHSLGEYAALQVSGAISLADMLYLVGHRARLLLERCEADACAMLAVSTSAAAVQELLNARPHSSCEIACTNSPSATVISGSSGDIAELRTTLTSRSTTLSVPYGFHSFQMDPMLEDYISLAGGVTYSVPKIPVASTLLASIVDVSGVFNGHYLGQQTRQAVDFVGALHAVKDKLDNPIWLEIGPSPVCGSFVRTTLSPSSGKIMSTLEASTNAWVSISKCLSGAYMDGIAIDWLAYHATFASSLKLLTLPSYAWDLKDFWIAYTESKQEGSIPAPSHVFETKISTCAQYVVQESASPTIQVTLGASTADPDFKALVDGHRMRGVSLCPGSVFCEAALAAAKYALWYSDRKDAANARLALRDVCLKRPLTKNLVGPEGKLLTTVLTEEHGSHSLQVSWQTSSAISSYDIGSCTVTVSDVDSVQADWDRVSYFVKTRMDGLTNGVKDGKGHRMLPGILYALFSHIVEYDSMFKCIKEAFISRNFEEATAEVVLQNDPPGTKFAASPYWGEGLVQLAGFLVNANPNRPAANTTFMMDSFDSFEQTVDLKSGHAYFVYVRVSRREKDTTNCDVYVFDSSKLVMQCSGLRFHEVSNDILDRLLGKSTPRSGNGSQDRENVPKMSISGPGNSSKAHKQARVESKPSPGSLSEAQKVAPKVSDTTAPEFGKEITSETGLYETILESIARATGSKVTDFTDDTSLAELGVDSIMGIEIAARVSNESGLDILPSFVVEHPTIGDLRNAFARSTTSTPHSEPISEFSLVEKTPESTEDRVLALETEIMVAQPPVKDTSPAPSARITLLQGRRSSGKPPFYLIADGTGSIATYVYLPPFKSKMPVYGIDSPYLRCPNRLTAEVGIPGAAKFIVEAMIRAQPEGHFSLGGFSGGAMLSYEVCRQLAAAGRIVDRLLLIDMCCPRPVGAEDKAEVGWKIYESIASQGGLWNASDLTQQHLRAIFASVAGYHPSSMTAEERPRRTAIIWGKKGLIDRCSRDVKLMQLLEDQDIPTEPFAKFMEGAKMGAIAWGLPHKTEADLGPNGWDRYVGETLCLSVDADHLEMPMPGHVHLLHGAMEEAFAYLSGLDD